MNKKGEYGVLIFLIIFLVSFAYFGSNYINNMSFIDLFENCEDFCLNESQEYYGVKNLEEEPICICSNGNYNVYKSSLRNFSIIKNKK